MKAGLKALLVGRIRSWFSASRIKAGFSFTGLEGFNQLLMLLVGLVVVRHMQNVEYGYYTISISTIGLCNALANSGLSAGFRKIGGEVHNKSAEFSSLYVSAVRERQLQSWFVIPASIGIAFYFLYRLEGLWLKSLVLSLLVGLNAVPELWRAISVEVLLLKTAWRTVQLQNLWGVVLRLGMIAALLTFGLSAGNMLLVNAAALWVVGWATYRAAKTKLRLPAPALPEQRREIRQIMNRVLPNAIFSVGLQQMGTFILASRGTVAAVADLGALTRLSSVFTIGISAVAQVVAPKFSKTHGAAAMRRIYWGTLGLVGLVAVFVLLVTWLFPAQLLSLLGPKYEHLQDPLLLSVTLTMLGVIRAVTMRLNQAKAWLMRMTKWNIPLTLAAVGAGFLLFDVSTLEGVLWLLLLSALPMLLLYFADARAGLREAARRSAGA